MRQKKNNLLVGQINIYRRYDNHMVEMKHTTALGITTIIGLVVVGNVVSVVMGQTVEETTTTKTFQLEGSHIDESVVGDVVEALGYNMTVFEPTQSGTVNVTVVGVRA
jgi:hypothetical protein